MDKKSHRLQKPKKSSVFAHGLCFKKLFLIFVIGSVFGDYYERVINLVGYSWGGTPWFWERRSGVIYGPFSIIYGLGAVAMILAFIALPRYLIEKRVNSKNYNHNQKQDQKQKSENKFLNLDDSKTTLKDPDATPLKWWHILILGALLGGIMEYFLGVLQETFTGTVSWNYSDHWLNIGAKTSPYVMLVWGIIATVLIKLAYPALSRLIEKIPVKIGNFIFWFMLIFLSLDMFVSFSAVLRMNLRGHNVPTFTPYGQFLDYNYPDDRIKKAYPNMVKL